jgi:hypothetical protein
MHQQGTRKETNLEVHGGLLALQEDIRLEKQSHGNPDMMQSKIRVARQQLDIMLTSIRMDGWSYLVPVGYIA